MLASSPFFTLAKNREDHFAFSINDMDAYDWILASQK
jgi:hypothetical protein